MKTGRVKKKQSKIVAVLPCRINSTRLLAKPLQKIGRYTILELLIRQIKKSKMTCDIVLAISENTGSDLFVEFAKKFKIKFVLGNEIDVLGRMIKGAESVNADIILRTTSENPFIYWEGIDELIKKHLDGKFDFTFHHGLPLGAGIEIINLQALRLSHKLGNKKHRSELSTLYIYENPNRFKIHKFEVPKILRKPKIRLTVDTPQDLWLARIIHEFLGSKNIPIPLKKIIKFLDDHPKFKKINSDLKIKYKRYM